jgi:hypothetical protein
MIEQGQLSLDDVIERIESQATLWLRIVAIDRDGVRYVIETKGQENIDVAHKDRAATIWCENATLLTETTWSYVKIPQVEFGKLQPNVLGGALIAFTLFDGDGGGL